VEDLGYKIRGLINHEDGSSEWPTYMYVDVYVDLIEDEKHHTSIFDVQRLLLSFSPTLLLDMCREIKQ
jgi:hypothetical protein